MYLISDIRREIRCLLPRTVFVSRLRATAGNAVLLTFDDGPHPETTTAVLELLKRHQARAAFFVVGNRVHRAPEMLRRIVDEGHFLGNHSYSHVLGRQPWYPRYLKDLRRCQNVIRRHAQVESILHRPPLGAITLATVLAPKRLGMRSVLWSRSSEDWRFRSDAQALAGANILASRVQARDILLFHDERRHTVTALKQLLPEFEDRGLTLNPCLDDLV